MNGASTSAAEHSTDTSGAVLQHAQPNTKRVLDTEVLQVLLQHTGITRNQKMVLTLLQASKALSIATTTVTAGQLDLMVCFKRLQHALSFARYWLPRHAGLRRDLQIELVGDGGKGGVQHPWASAIQATATALQAVKEEMHGLKSLALTGSELGSVSPALPHLPTSLTQLCVFADRTSDSRAVARLSALRSLSLSTAQGPATLLKPLAQLVQLTELKMRGVSASQLQQLPPLPQLHCSGHRCSCKFPRPRLGTIGTCKAVRLDQAAWHTAEEAGACVGRGRRNKIILGRCRGSFSSCTSRSRGCSIHINSISNQQTATSVVCNNRSPKS